MLSLFLLGILILSCASNTDALLNHEVPESHTHTGFVYDDNLELEISFIGIIADRYVFETVLSNLSASDIRVHKNQFVMEHQGVSILHTDDLQSTITEVKKDQKKLAKRRKINNWINGISAGIGLISSITAGTTAPSTLISSIEPTLYIVDENIWITKDIQSSEDYISYLQTAQYDNDIIASGASLTRDIFFNVFEINQDVEIEFRIEGFLYDVAFPQTAFTY